MTSRTRTESLAAKRVRRAPAALLICDMLNTFEFPEAKLLHPAALRAARAVKRLKVRAKAAGVPVIYVNDNFGHWLSDWRTIFDLCTRPECLGKEIAELLRPDSDDYFILKPKHSGFHFTSLEVLLGQMKTRRLIITGVAGDICVLFTAHDAHMRDYEVIVPRDCVASNRAAANAFALRQLRDNFGMNIAPSTALTAALKSVGVKPGRGGSPRGSLRRGSRRAASGK